jgi:hypothetical protein
MVPRFFEDGADAANGGAVVVGGTVREIHAEHVHARIQKLF